MKKNRWIVCLLVIAAAAGGYFCGKNSAESKAKTVIEAEHAGHKEELDSCLTARDEYEADLAKAKADQELDILLDRSDLEGLGEIEGPIYVTGHKTPDTDTVCGSIAYANLLRELGYDANAVVLGPVNKETAFILDAADVEVPMQLESAAGLNMVLIDHNEYIQSAEGLNDANIVTIIDHHGSGNAISNNRMIYDARPLGASSTIVWIRYRNYGVEVNKQMAVLMLGGILSDTVNMKSSATSADREAVRILSETAGIDDTNAFYQNMFKATLSYEGKTDEEIFLSDYKEYESGGKKFSIGVVNVYDEEEAKQMAERMKAVLPGTLPSTGMDIAVAQVSIFHDDLSITYLVPSDDYAKEVLQTAFEDRAVFDGTSFVLKPGIGRKQVLVPAISDVLAAHPGE